MIRGGKDRHNTMNGSCLLVAPNSIRSMVRMCGIEVRVAIMNEVLMERMTHIDPGEL